jgi:hypothetical protein
LRRRMVPFGSERKLLMLLELCLRDDYVQACVDYLKPDVASVIFLHKRQFCTIFNFHFWRRGKKNQCARSTLVKNLIGTTHGDTHNLAAFNTQLCTPSLVYWAWSFNHSLSPLSFDVTQ